MENEVKEIEKRLIKHMVLLGWFFEKSIYALNAMVTDDCDSDLVMVCGHDGSEEKRPCGLVWMKHGPHQFWIQRPSNDSRVQSIGDYVPLGYEIA